MFEVNAKLTEELVEEMDEADNIFYRWQNPIWNIEGEYTQSWGMVFSSAEEARECAEEWGMDEDEAVLPGKSCYEKFEDACYSNASISGYVLLAFKGVDTYTTGHDGETVAEYIEPFAVFSRDDVYDFANKVNK